MRVEKPPVLDGRDDDEAWRDAMILEDFRMAVEEECKEHAITEISVWEKRQREIHQPGTDPMVG